MKFWKISPLESTQFLQIWPFFVGIGLTRIMTKKSQPNSYKVNPIPTTKVNPIPTKSTQFLQWILSQPNSYKCWFQPNSYNQVNPITANQWIAWVGIPGWPLQLPKPTRPPEPGGGGAAKKLVSIVTGTAAGANTQNSLLTWNAFYQPRSGMVMQNCFVVVVLLVLGRTFG